MVEEVASLPAPAEASPPASALPEDAPAVEKLPEVSPEKLAAEARADLPLPADEQNSPPEEEKEAVDAQDKAVVVESDAPEKGADRELSPSSTEDTTSSSAFKEESYHVKDLKESEKKALLELKAKIEEAITNNAFLAPQKPAVEAREVEVEKKEVEEGKREAGEESKVEEKEESPAIEAPAGSAAPVDNPVVEESVIAEVAASNDPPLVDESVSSTGAVDAAPATIPEEDEVVKTVALPVEAKEDGKPKEELVAAAEEEPAPEGDADAKTASRDIPMEEETSVSFEDLALWGIPLLHSKGDERTDVILLKFLRARDFKVNEAFGMLKDTVIWRKEFETDNLVGEDITSEFDSVAYMHGVDKEGHPVCYNNYGVFQDKELYRKTFGDKDEFNKFLRWRIQVLEKGIKKLDFSAGGVHSMVQITDLKGSPGFVKRRNITKNILSLLQDNYPELVAKQIFINVPWYFGALYSLHGKIVTPRSKSKIVVARPGGVTETLFKYISPENVPVQYGGFSRPDDSEFKDVEAPIEEVTVKAGEKQTIEIPVLEAGSTVVWDVTVVGWDVVYGEEFVPSGEGSYTVIVQKPKKMGAAEEPLRNSFKATEPGKLVFTIDNTASRKKKLAVYRYTVREAPTEC